MNKEKLTQRKTYDKLVELYIADNLGKRSNQDNTICKANIYAVTYTVRVWKEQFCK